MAERLGAETAAVMAHEIVEEIRGITATDGPRPPGSPGERACQERLRAALQASGLSPCLEPFDVAQKAFMAMPMVCTALALCAMPLYWFAPHLSPLPVVLAMVVFVCELVLYRHVLTPLFPKHPSVNLSATVKPHGETRQRILLVGHADAAYEWNYLRLFPKVFMAFPLAIILAMTYMLLSTVAVALLGGDPMAPGVWRWLGYVQLAFIPDLALGLFYANFRRVSPGAADNLSGSLLATRVAQWFQDNAARLERTEVVALVTGSEEAGLVGARAYIKKHLDELQRMPTIVVAVDTIAELAHLMVYTRDLNGRVHHDQQVCALLHTAAKECGLSLADGCVTVGASDAAAFTQAGVPSAALCAMDPSPAHYYHNRRDTWETLEEPCIARTLQLLETTCVLYDRDGLPSPRD